MITILDHLMMAIILSITYTFSIDIRRTSNLLNQKNLNFYFLVNIPAVIYAYSLVSTSILVSIGSDEQRHFDLI